MSSSNTPSKSDKEQTYDSPPTHSEDTIPPPYDAQKIQNHFSALSQGPLDEIVEVPMITRTGLMLKDSIHWLNPFSRKGGEIKTSVTSRKMTRDFYLKHYAKDAEGKYVGTGAPAPDAALVFVPGKGGEEDIQKMVDEVALGKQRIRGGGIGKFGTPLKDGEGK